MSFYGVIEDSALRPPELPALVLALRDWPSLLAFCELVIAFVYGVVYLHFREKEEFHNIREISSGGQTINKSEFTLMSLVNEKHTFMLSFH